MSVCRIFRRCCLVAILAWTTHEAAQAALADALDAPGLAWATGGDVKWQEVTVPDANQGHTVVSGTPSNHNFWSAAISDGWMEATVLGPAVFSVRARMNSTPYMDIGINIDGAPVSLTRRVPGGNYGSHVWEPWTTVSCHVPAGEHRVRLTACMNCSNSSLPTDGPACQLDAVVVKGADTAVATALDSPSITWFTAGSPAPGVVTGDGDSHDGQDAVMMVDHPSEAWLLGTMTGPATLEWFQRGRGPVTFNGSEYSLDDASWSRQKIFVPPGAAHMRWDFGRSRSTTTRSLTLDEFAVVPSVALSPQEAVSTPETLPGLVFSSGWAGAATSGAPDGQNLAWVTVADSARETLRVPVSGAGILAMQLAMRNAAYVTFMINGREVAYDSEPAVGEFTAFRIFTPPDAEWFEVGVQVYPPAPSVYGTVLLDGIRFLPAESLSLSTVLDEPALRFTTHPDRPWTPLAWANAVDGIDSCPSPDTTKGESWLETELPGPGTLRFEWTTYVPWDEVVLLLDDSPLALSAGAQTLRGPQDMWGAQRRGWAEVEVGPGSHRLRWLVPEGAPFGLFALDRVAWTPHAPSAGAAVLGSASGWMSFRLPWVTDESVSKSSGGASLRFGPAMGLITVAGSLDPQIQLPLRGPGIARFHVRTQAGSLGVAVPGQQFRIYASTGASGWTSVEAFVPTGATVLQLSPYSDGTVVPVATTIWIDEFTFTDLRRPLTDALPGLPWKTNPENPWEGTPTDAVAGPPLSSPSWLETTVTGPCLVDWMISGTSSFAVDGKRIAKTDYSYEDFVQASVFLDDGVHTLRWTNDEPWDEPKWYGAKLREVTVSPLSGLPSFSVQGDALRYMHPRPAGVLDSQLSPQVNDGTNTWHTLGSDAYIIRESTPDRVLFEVPIVPGQREMLLRLKFQR